MGVTEWAKWGVGWSGLAAQCPPFIDVKGWSAEPGWLQDSSVFALVVMKDWKCQTTGNGAAIECLSRRAEYHSSVLSWGTAGARKVDHHRVGLEADKNHTHLSSSSYSSNEDGEEESSDEDDIMSVQLTRKAPPGLLHRFQEAKQQTDYGNDNCWDSSRHSNPSSFWSSLLFNPNSPAFHQMSSSVIFNPTPFGFDDCFYGPTCSFPQSFQDHSNLGESDDRDPGEGGGYDDDFGGLSP
ncbi:hypothetical protein PGTUg99_034225 [Puccinia graminis f. sp. tritici]|uniref:Uncharacterized protein n=1 Tax=Puccinia graminis f. sp. tritici TaxID=56615 RepID=A0A5B0SNM6_PUCGR|nr:hypothetical protein PGTUg99_034225 [Puccinia graminis f. sp. tritici]